MQSCLSSPPQGINVLYSSTIDKKVNARIIMKDNAGCEVGNSKIDLEEKDERTIAEVLEDMQAESDGIAAAVAQLKQLLGGIEI